jgi:hypothetical protein
VLQSVVAEATTITAAVVTAGLALVATPIQAHADTLCYHGDVMRGASGQGDWYLCMGDPSRQQPGAWQHIVPFFDPNSADGYGGMQLMPPLCVRFPNDYPTCNGVIYQFPTGY